MEKPLRVLFIEDVEDHVLLIVRELQKGGLEIDFLRVETLQELDGALEAGGWDAVISDFNLPGFNGVDALQMVQQKRLDLPFLLVSGAIGEEKAAEVMKAGAHDYIRKGNYARLVPTLERELRDAKLRHERRQTAEELTRYRERLEELVQERTAELVRVNQALQDEKQEREQILLQLEAILESIKEGVVISDLQGNLLRMNREALALHQYHSADQARQQLSQFREIYQLSDLEGRPVPFEEWPLVRAIHGERFSDCEVEVRRKDAGAKPWVASISGGPVYNDAGEAILAVITVRDITERKRAEEEVERLNAALATRISQLEETNQELEAFNRIVSHDLRQPLNMVGLACQELDLLWGDKLEQEGINSTKVALGGVQRMNGLIESLLKFSRSTHGVVTCERIDLSSLGEGVIEQLKLSEPERRVSFRLQQGMSVEGDPVLLRSVLDNLLGNAWKYTGARDEAIIEFGATEIDGQEAYFVRDNGVGFDMADAEKLFTPFQRLDRVQQFEGFGIGLATVQRIIRRHGGRIWAEGEPDRGASFYFTVNTRQTICGQ